MTLEEAFENDPQARAEFHDYLDEMAEEHVHVAERLHDRDEEWDEEDEMGRRMRRRSMWRRSMRSSGWRRY